MVEPSATDSTSSEHRQWLFRLCSVIVVILGVITVVMVGFIIVVCVLMLLVKGLDLCPEETRLHKENIFLNTQNDFLRRRNHDLELENDFLKRRNHILEDVAIHKLFQQKEETDYLKEKIEDFERQNNLLRSGIEECFQEYKHYLLESAGTLFGIRFSVFGYNKIYDVTFFIDQRYHNMALCIFLP